MIFNFLLSDGGGGGAEALQYLTCKKGFSISFVNVLLNN